MINHPLSISFTVCVAEPVSGPNMSVLVHEDKRILIRWDELAVDQQRGFITNYTIYLQTLDSSNTELSGEQLYCVVVSYAVCTPKQSSSVLHEVAAEISKTIIL